MAFGGYDGSIRIDSQIDRKNFNAGIKSMMGSLKGLAAAVGVAFGVAAVTLFGKSAVSAASDLAAAMTGLQSVTQGTGKSFADAQKFINTFISDGLVPATNAITAYKNLALRGYSTAQIEKVMTALKDSASFGRQSSLTLGQAVQSASEGLKNENSILVDNAGVTKNVAKMWDEYAKSIGTTANNLTQQQKIQAEVNGIMNETRFQTGDAAKLSAGYAGQVAALGTSFYNFKVAIGNAIIPVLTKIIPVIKQVVDWLVVLANQFAQIVSALTGVKIGNDALADSTKGAADASQDQAEAIDAAKKAAKGALAAFDELNVLQSEQAGTTPGGTAAPVIDTTPTESGLGSLGEKIAAFKEKLLALLQPVIEALGRLGEALQPLGENIWAGLKWAWDNILVPLGEWVITDLLPAFLDLLTAAITVLNSAIEALKPLGKWLFEKFVQPAASWVGDALINGLKWLTDRLYDLSGWMNKHQKTVQDIAKVILIFAAAWLALNIAAAIWTAIVTVATVVTTAFGVAMAILTSPILLVILAIGALIIILYLLYTHWDDVKKKAGEVWEDIKEKWGEFKDWFSENVWEPLKERFKNAWDGIKDLPRQAWEKAKEAWQNAKTWFDTTVLNPLKNAFSTALDTIKQSFSTIFGGITTFVKGQINIIIGFVNTMISAIASGLNSVIGAMNSIHVSIPSWVPQFGGNTWGISIPLVTAPQIPRLATGAVIPPNAAFAAILGDQRSGRNLEAPEGLIRQIIREEMGQQNIRVSFEGTLGALVRELKPHIDKETVRIGGSLIQSGVTS